MRWVVLAVGLIFLTGCATTYIGMSQQEFLNNFSSQVVLASMNAQQAIYQDGGGLYYYFINERLTQIDRGIPYQQRVQYEIINRHE